MWMRILFSVVCVLANPPCAMAMKRISSHVSDLSMVQPIFMIPGMVTLLELPTPITGIRIGNPDLVGVLHAPTSPSEVTLVLKSLRSQPTNLILKSNEKKYIFDIVPSKTMHQDLLEVVASVGGPSFVTSKRLLDASAPQAVPSIPRRLLLDTSP